MDDKRTARFLGVLLVSAIVCGILNTVPALEYPDYLEKLSTIRTQVLTAVFFQAAMATIYVYIAVSFYRVLRKRDDGLAAAYLAFRIIGAVFLYVGIGSLLLLLMLSRRFAAEAPPDPSYYRTLGELLRQGRDLMNHVGMILPWMTGGLILCYSLFKERLVPRWLSAWGFAGAALSVLATVMLMLGFIEMVTPIYFAMNTPTALFELSLAAYLVFRGFDAAVPGRVNPAQAPRSRLRLPPTPSPPGAP